MSEKNPSKKCRDCGAKVKSNKRFCKDCWEARKRGKASKEGV